MGQIGGVSDNCQAGLRRFHNTTGWVSGIGSFSFVEKWKCCCRRSGITTDQLGCLATGVDNPARFSQARGHFEHWRRVVLDPRG
jgi:hypothetical protein